jgi:glycosyltransferase involved in cell wall biosynthesis
MHSCPASPAPPAFSEAGEDRPQVALAASPEATKRQAAPITVLYLDHTAAASGGEIALVRLLGALDPEVVRPVVLVAADGPMVRSLEALNITTHVLPLGEHVRNVRKDTLGLAALWKFGAFLSIFWYGLRVAWFARRCGAKIIHTNSLKADIYGGIAAFFARLPVVWHVRDYINRSYLPGPAVAIFRFLVGKIPSFVVANSQSTLDELHLGGACRAAVVPSGLRLKSRVVHDGLVHREFDEEAGPGLDSQRGKATSRRPFRIGMIGRITRWKGQHIFLEAAAQITAAGYVAEFLIVGAPLFGEQEYERELREQAEKAGLSGRLTFLGFKENVQEVLRSLDVFVHASISPEPFGQVVIEAMAEGVPVIATNGGGVREIISHGTSGLLVPMGDAGALAAALESLLSNPREARRLGAAGYHRVRSHFTAAQSARKIERIYRDLLGTAAASL